MKTSTDKSAAQLLPSFPQVVALAIEKAEISLRRLIEIRCGDEKWADEDADVDFAVELAAAHIERMKGMGLQNYDDFSQEWFKVAGAVQLGRKAFSRGDCWYFRALVGTCGMFEQIAELVEFAEGAAAELEAA